MLLVLGWFAYGISNALDSGTIDVKIINDIKKLNQQDKLVTFISNSNRFNFISLLIGSTVGSFLYFRVGLKIYVVGIILTIISILTIYLFYDETVSNAEQKAYFEQITFAAFFKKIILQGKEGIKELKNSPTLRMMIALTFIGQFFFQAHFQLWQALFLTKNVSKHDFYLSLIHI
ncbi:MFS transporter, partial [Pediococcus acidilactici]